VDSGGSEHILGAHCRHLANTIEPSMCGGEAAFLSNYFDHLIVTFWGLVISLERVKLWHFKFGVHVDNDEYSVLAQA